MIQNSTILVRVVLRYDDETTTEAVAQERFLDGLDDTNGVHHAVIVAGLVDADGVPINKRAPR